MFKKPKRNFRRRQDSEEAEDEETKGEEEVAPAPQPPQAVKKTKKKKKEEGLSRTSSAASILSFEEEADGEIFQVKKSSHSKRVYKQLKKETKREKEERERREEEERNKPRETKNIVLEPIPMETVAMEVSGESGSGSDGRRSITPPSQSDEESEDPNRPKHTFNQPTFSDILRSGVIPDANMIHMARKRRQAARDRGDEFIPVGDQKGEDSQGGRLIRDDDHDKSDEDDERINFRVHTRDEELKAMQNTILAAAEESHSDASDQEQQWEEQQIRKGTKTLATQALGDTQNGSQSMFYGYAGDTGYGSTVPEGMSFNGPMKQDDGQPVTLSSIQRRLRQQLDEIGTVHRAHMHERDDIESRLETCESSIENVEVSKKVLEEDYKFYQEMRGYCRDLVSCLNEKMGSIAYLERCMNMLWKQKAEKLVKRRQEDIKDQSQDLMSSKAVAGISLTGNSTSDADAAKQRRVAEREARRARRRRKREAFNVKDHREGLSTDDEESNADAARYKTERERLMRESSTMFEDTLDEFQEFTYIKSRFEEWKKSHCDSYSEAYIGLCLPKLFTPLIRNKLVCWNPLEQRTPDFEEMGWFEALMFYGYKEDEEPADDQDLVLMPSIVDKVLVPKLTGLVETYWDPMSTSQTRRLFGVTAKLVIDYPLVDGESKNITPLIKAIVLRMQRALDEDIFVPLYPKNVLENRNSPATMFFHRQFWSTVKLLGNILMWDGIVATKTLKELGLDGLANRYILLGLMTSVHNQDSVTKCNVISSHFPRTWFASLEGDTTIPQLENFCRFLVQMAKSFEQKMKDEKDSERRAARDHIKQITKILVNIHATNHALELAEMYSLKL